MLLSKYPPDTGWSTHSAWAWSGVWFTNRLPDHTSAATHESMVARLANSSRHPRLSSFLAHGVAVRISSANAIFSHCYDTEYAPVDKTGFLNPFRIREGATDWSDAPAQYLARPGKQRQTTLFTVSVDELDAHSLFYHPLSQPGRVQNSIHA